jgi:hypothetical protein
MKKTLMFAMMAALSLPSVFAKEEVNEELVNNYMRSSIYTVLLSSSAQNQYYQQEAENAEANKDALVQAASAVANKETKTIDSNMFSLPATLFPNIAIPNQFNNHNLDIRIIDYEKYRDGITEEEAAKYNPKSKGGKFGALAKGAAGSVMGAVGGKSESSMLHTDEVDEYAAATINKYFTSNNVAPNMLAKWFGYDEKSAEHWNFNLIVDRGKYNFNADEIALAGQDQAVNAKIQKTGFDMINNTYVVALNLKFRSYQAVQQEAAAMAKTAGSMFGGVGSLAAQAASTVSSAAVGDGYTVQAVAYLYKLKWDDEIANKFATEIFDKKATLADLINSGICELEFVGREKASANVRQSVMSDKPISDLVERATTRAIDASIAKLQEKNEVFRTATPIIGGDGNGTVYAAIGTKEGLGEKDVYEILEAQEDSNGHLTYKSIGEVKPVKGKIWNNVYGAEEEAAENASNGSSDKDFDNDAVSLKYSEFKGKKGDYTGYYIRLKKKK